MPINETLEQVIKAFDDNDIDAIINSFAENGQWEMVGIETVTGRDNLRTFFDRHMGNQMLDSTKDHKIIAGNTAVVDGQAKCKGPDGNVMDLWYCDLYDFEGDKIKLLKSYCVMKK